MQMRRLLIVIGTALLFLVLAPAATAKGPIELCGAGGCATLAEEGALSQLHGTAVEPGVTPLQPYYVLRFRDLGHLLGYWVPGRGLLRSTQPPVAWYRPAPEIAATIAAVVSALEPHVAPRVAGVVVDGREMRRGAAFLRRLFAGGVRTPALRGTRWVEVFVFGAGSPWTDGFTSISVSRRGSFLRRGTQTFRVAPAFAASIRDGTPLR